MNYKETIKFLKENENNRSTILKSAYKEIFKIENNKLYASEQIGEWFEIKHKDPTIIKGTFVRCYQYNPTTLIYEDNLNM